MGLRKLRELKALILAGNFAHIPVTPRQNTLTPMALVPQLATLLILSLNIKA